MQNKTNDVIVQDVLVDIGRNGKNRNWAGRKMANELLALAYDAIDTAKASRLRTCGSQLTFKIHSDGHKTLDSMISCRVRLCPICAWRRSLKVFNNTMRCLSYINDERDNAYIFATFTMRNCNGDDLKATLDTIFQALNRFFGYKEIKNAFRGFYRGVEVTHNTDYHSENYNTYHPHVHLLLHTKTAYWGRAYLKQERFTELWAQALGANYTPIVHVQKTYGSDARAVAEVSKYATKSADYILVDDWDLTIETVRLLDGALNNRRLVAYGGTLRDAHRALKLDDEDNGDLVDVGDTPNGIDGEYMLKTYFWHTGYRQYVTDAKNTRT